MKNKYNLYLFYLTVSLWIKKNTASGLGTTIPSIQILYKYIFIDPGRMKEKIELNEILIQDIRIQKHFPR